MFLLLIMCVSVSMCIHTPHTQGWYHHQQEFLLQELSCVWPSPIANIQRLFLSPSGQIRKGNLTMAPKKHSTFVLLPSLRSYLLFSIFIASLNHGTHCSARVYCVHSNAVGSWTINPQCPLGLSLRIILPMGEVSDLHQHESHLFYSP